MFVGFDVGETLVQYEGVALDWTEHYRPALNQALAEKQISADEDSFAAAIEILTFYNTRRNPRSFEIGAGEVTAKIARLFDIEASVFERAFFSYFQRRASPTPGALSLLKTLNASGAYLAALSDVPYGMPTEMLLEDLGALASEFRSIASSCDVGCRKPNGNGLRQLLALSGANGSNAFYVGNEEKDMEAACHAGINGILLSQKERMPDFGQRYTVRTLAEVAKTVLSSATQWN